MSEDTLYLRGKMAERAHQGAQFTQDGFDYWAETEAPARVGQVQKIPAEPTKQMEGDALRRLYARHARHHELEGGRRMRMHHEEEFEGDALRHLMHSRHHAEEFEGDALRRRRRGDGLGSLFSKGVSAINKVVSAGKTALDYYNSLKSNPVFASLSDSVQKSLEDYASSKGIDVAKVADAVNKYGPQAEAMLAKMQGDGRRRKRGDGTKKGMMRKSARRAYMPAEELEGGYARGSKEWKQAWAEYLTAHPHMYARASIPAGGFKSSEEYDIWESMKQKDKEYDAERAKYADEKHGDGRRKRRGKKHMEEELEGGERYGAHGDGRKARKPSARNMIVKKVMAEHGLSLPQASKYVKEHGLY